MPATSATEPPGGRWSGADPRTATRTGQVAGRHTVGQLPIRVAARVDLPEPFGPMRVWVSPGCMSRFTPWRMACPHSPLQILNGEQRLRRGLGHTGQSTAATPVALPAEAGICPLWLSGRVPPVLRRSHSAAAYQPRSIHSCRWGLSCPMVVSLPWPGMTMVSGASRENSNSSMEPMMVEKSPQGNSAGGGEPCWCA